MGSVQRDDLSHFLPWDFLLPLLLMVPCSLGISVEGATGWGVSAQLFPGADNSLCFLRP